MSKQTALLVLCIVFCTGAAPTTRDDTAKKFQVIVAPGRSTRWEIEAFKSNFASHVKTIPFTSHGRAHTADAVSLLDVLNDAGLATSLKMDPTADPSTKNKPLRQTLLITGRDGYQAAIAVAELLPDIGNHEAWLAFDRDGKPLDDRSAPVELIVPGDVKPGRWVRGVENICVQPAPPLSMPTTHP